MNAATGWIAALAGGAFLLAAPCGGAGAAEPAPADAAVATKTDGAALSAELESIDREVQRGLAALAEATKGAASDRRQWAAMDRSIASARAVNRALGARNKAVVALYDAQVSGPLARFEKRLKEAPAVYRKMAEERRAQQAAATLEIERRSYLAMAVLCESAAVLCEVRHEELFGTGTEVAGGATRPRRNATALAETISNMKKLSAVHDRWEETFAAYPSSLDDGRLSTLFDYMAAYAEDLDAFTRGVEALKDVMKKAGEKPQADPKAGAQVQSALTYRRPPVVEEIRHYQHTVVVAYLPRQ